MKKPKRSPITPEQIECAARAKAIYLDRKESIGLTQDQIAASMDITQSAVTQFLNGTVAMSLRAKFNMAKALKCRIGDIDPELADLSYLDQRDRELIEGFRSLSPDLQAFVETAIKQRQP